VQMPAGVPVATFAIGRPGAVNAALFAAAIVARGRPPIEAAIDKFRHEQTERVLREPDPETASRSS
jgi:5-(carboxyamino)imidazole ribonucleotide mutase